MKFCRPRTILLLLFAAMLAGLLPQRATAQLMVTLEMNKKAFLAYEPILATVVVANRTGKDVILGDHQGRGWLAFDIASIGGDRVRPLATAPRLDPKVVEKGKSVRDTVSLGHFYPLGGQDNYSVRAAVYFSETGQAFVSNTAAIRIMEGQRFWEDKVGITRPNNPTVYRRFSLISFQEENKMSLYVRVRDEKTQRVVATYALGRLVPHREPQATLDGENQLHVLFLTGPHYFRHCVIDADGHKISEQIHEDKSGSFPTLMVSDTGAVRVDGGRPYDPNAPPEQPREVIHRLTERPPGAPPE
ncbi:MAG: hypothetical protein ACR2OZ_02495 [Verrucomicrobiales bacterium]